MSASRERLDHLRLLTYLWFIMMASVVIIALWIPLSRSLPFLVGHIAFSFLLASEVGLVFAVDWRNRGVTRSKTALKASVGILIGALVLGWLADWFGYFGFLIIYLAIGAWLLLSILVGLKILKARRELRAPE